VSLGLARDGECGGRQGVVAGAAEAAAFEEAVAREPAHGGAHRSRLDAEGAEDLGQRPEPELAAAGHDAVAVDGDDEGPRPERGLVECAEEVVECGVHESQQGASLA